MPSTTLKNTICLTCFVVLSYILLGQNNYNNWHFGRYAGVSFNTIIPTAITNSAMTQLEGCASESDPITGALRFYTNGISVWNSNNTVMPNGTNLFGAASSAQSALIVPMPSDTSKFYIFTVSNYFTNGSPGAHYSLVDMNLNGGLGDVTTKNVLLHNPTSEKLVATHQANNFDYWVLTHSFNGTTFYTYPVTNSGVGVPIISTCSPNFGGTSSIGCMKLSPDGSQLAVARSGSNAIEIYNFDRYTGIVSGPAFTISSIAPNGLVYGVAFSPNGKILYSTVNDNGFVYQFDLSSGNQATITASKTIVGNAPGSQYFRSMAMQLGPDKKLYIVSDMDHYIAAISDPDIVGNGCNYNPYAVYLTSSKTGALGLPNCIETILIRKICAFNLCAGDSAIFNSFSTAGLSQSYWNFGDTLSNSNIDSGFSASHFYGSPGSYTVQQIKVHANGIIDTIIQQITIHYKPYLIGSDDTTLCFGQQLTLTPVTNATNYTWQNGSTLSSFTVSLAGTYIVTVTNTDGCKATDTTVINYISCGSPPIVSFYSSDTILCEKSAIDFFDISTNNPTQWQWSFPGASPSSSTVQNPTGIYYPTYGAYTVTLVATNANGSDSLTITQYITVVANPPAPSVTVNGSFMCCNNVAVWYQWYYNNVAIPNANAMCYNAMQPGNYYVLITDSNGCNSGSGQIVISSLNETNVGPNFNAWYDATSGNVNVVMTKSKNEKATVTIYDVLGQTIKQIEEENSENNKIMIIPAQFIAKGIYMIEVATKQKTSSGKLLIH